jgi:hypothetical protein
MMVLRAARVPELTGLQPQRATVTLNGRLVASDAVLVASMVYMPVLDYAAAAGWRATWDAETGALALSKAGRPAVALKALSASVNGGPATLAVPLLSDTGKPVMALADLVSVLGGTLTRAGSEISIVQ